MKYRPFGKTGLHVSEIGFGGARLGGLLAQGQGHQQIRVLRRARDEGINFFDTADMYSQGEGEALLGRAFQGRRDTVILATKGGYCLPAQRRLAAYVKPILRPLARLLGVKRQNLPPSVTGKLSQDFSPRYLVPAIEASLRRLKTDYLDLFQLHSPPAPFLESGEFRETLESLETMKRQGKIRHYGVAADTVHEAEFCLRCPEISSVIGSVQFPFGLLDRQGLGAVPPAAEGGGLGIIARGCFGGGLLKDTLTEPELKQLTPKWPRILELRRLSQQRERSLLEMALQHNLHVPTISVTLLGMRTEKHLQDNLRFYAARPLTESEFALL